MFKKLILSLLLPFLLIGCEDKKPNEQVLKVATSGDNSPFEFYENGKLTGFDIKLMEKIAKQLGKTVEFIDMDFGGIIAALQSRRVDVAIAAFTPTEERKKAVDFSDIYYEALPSFIVLQGTPPISLHNSQGKTLGVQMGTTHERAAHKISEQNPSLEVLSLNKIPDLIQALKARRINAILIGSTEAYAIVHADSTLSTQEARDLPIVEVGNVIVFPKGSLLKGPVNEALKALEKDNTITSLKKEWDLK